MPPTTGPVEQAHHVFIHFLWATLQYIYYHMHNLHASIVYYHSCCSPVIFLLLSAPESSTSSFTVSVDPLLSFSMSLLLLLHVILSPFVLYVSFAVRAEM